MTKRKRKAKPQVTLPATPTSWDMGATGQANQAGLILEPRGDINPETGKVHNVNGERGMRRIDNLEVWHNCFKAGMKNRAWITTEQYNTAVRIRAAYEGTERAPGTDYARPRVDSSPKPDHAIMVQITRISALHKVIRHVGRDDLSLIWHCVVLGQLPSLYRHDGRLIYAGRNYNDGFPALRAALDRAC